MDAGERDARLRGLCDIVCHNDIDRWGREFLAAVAAVPAVVG
jgi:glucosylglycerol-phosphate synthase